MKIMTQALTLLGKKPLRYKEFQQVLWNINGNKGIVSQGYYCTNINTIKGNNLIVKKGNKYHLTTIGKNNINKPYSIPREKLQKQLNKYYDLHYDNYHTIRHLKNEISELKTSVNQLQLLNEEKLNILIGCANTELRKVVDSNKFNSELLQYLLND